MASPLLEVERVSRSFGGVRALDRVSLSLVPGQLRCIIGPNGAGKSTLFKVMIGSVTPDAGRVRFRGRDVTRVPTHARARLGIGIKYQSMAVYAGCTVSHNLRLPLQHGRSEARLEEDARILLERLRLEGTENKLAGELSHGQKQWLAIGMALAMRPSLLLLDEPTAGLGPEETRETGELVREVNEEGVTILVVEHDMAFVRQLGAPVTVLHFGRVIADGPLAEIEHDPQVRRIYLGSSELGSVRRRGKGLGR